VIDAVFHFSLFRLGSGGPSLIGIVAGAAVNFCLIYFVLSIVQDRWRARRAGPA
jgi:hypothetical protein